MPQESSCLGDFSCPGDAARTAHATRRHGPPRSAATQCTRGSSISRTFPVSRRTGCLRAGPTRDHRSCAAHPTGATTSRRSTPGVGSVGRSTRARLPGFGAFTPPLHSTRRGVERRSVTVRIELHRFAQQQQNRMPPPEASGSGCDSAAAGLRTAAQATTGTPRSAAAAARAASNVARGWPVSSARARG